MSASSWARSPSAVGRRPLTCEEEEASDWLANSPKGTGASSNCGHSSGGEREKRRGLCARRLPGGAFVRRGYPQHICKALCDHAARCDSGVERSELSHKANIASCLSHENIPPNVRNVISHTATPLLFGEEETADRFSTAAVCLCDFKPLALNLYVNCGVAFVLHPTGRVQASTSSGSYAAR